MASSAKSPLDDSRRTTGSPKMKTRGELDGDGVGDHSSIMERWDGLAGSVHRGWTTLTGVWNRQREGYIMSQCNHLWPVSL